MVMISKETGDSGSFYLNTWDMQHYQRGREMTSFTPRPVPGHEPNYEIAQDAEFVDEVVAHHLGQLERSRHNPNVVPPIEPRLDAKYAPVVIAALRHNLYAKLPHSWSQEVPYGYRQLDAKTGVAVRKLARIASQAAVTAQE